MKVEMRERREEQSANWLEVKDGDLLGITHWNARIDGAFNDDLDEATLLAYLRQGDNYAFTYLDRRYGQVMLQMAMSMLESRASAEEVLQETWLAVVKGIDRFEGRSSLKTWIFRILINRAITRRHRDQRTIPFTHLGREREEEGQYVEWLIHRHLSNQGRDMGSPEKQLWAREIREIVEEELKKLPTRQQRVVYLRDLQDWDSKAVCQALEITEANQRVLLHRGRVKLREALEKRLNLEDVPFIQKRMRV